MKSLPEDPIVEEIRAVRRELTKRFGDDINALCDFLVQEEQQHKERLVNRPPKAPQHARAAVAERR
ncbi:MAG: hypothetical protein DMF06_11095 [Verrucomicrobia bacterium]|nr:MAG: hypothetical protein DMF06_11095 [Verrucomicrobiota bacterium]